MAENRSEVNLNTFCHAISYDVPEWHKEKVYATLEALKKNPEKALSEEAFWEAFNKIGNK